MTEENDRCDLYEGLGFDSQKESRQWGLPLSPDKVQSDCCFHHVYSPPPHHHHIIFSFFPPLGPNHLFKPTLVRFFLRHLCKLRTSTTHEYLDTITLGVLINNYCYGKSQVRITRDFLFVDLRKVLNSLTYRFLRVELSISITIHGATKSRIICLIKTETLLLSNSQFLMKRTKQKTTRPDNQQNRDQPEL